MLSSACFPSSNIGTGGGSILISISSCVRSEPLIAGNIAVCISPSLYKKLGVLNSCAIEPSILISEGRLNSKCTGWQFSGQTTVILSPCYSLTAFLSPNIYFTSPCTRIIFLGFTSYTNFKICCRSACAAKLVYCTDSLTSRLAEAGIGSSGKGGSPLSIRRAGVRSIQYPVITTPLVSLGAHFSNRSLEMPLCNIPGLAITTHRCVSSNCSIFLIFWTN